MFDYLWGMQRVEYRKLKDKKKEEEEP